MSRRARRNIDWSAIPLGTATDRVIAKRYDLHEAVVARARKARGIPPASRTPGALVDGTTRYEDDVAAQLFVRTFSGGASLEQVGDAFGVTRERIRQIEEQALRRLAARLALVGIDVADLDEVLARRGRQQG